MRWKLTLWYGLMCALTVGLLGYGMRWALRYEINADIDARLRATAAEMVPALLQGSDLQYPTVQDAFRVYASRVQAALYDNSNALSQPGQIEQVVLAGPPAPGECLIRPQSTQATSDPCDFHSGPPGIQVSPLLLMEVAGTGSRLVDIPSGGQTLRAYITPFNTPTELKNAGVFGVLMVFQTPHTYNRVEDAFTVILLVGIPLALLVALVLGWWIARAALRPIERISRTVQSIGDSRDMSRRLHFLGPMDEVGRLANTFDDMMGRLEQVFDTQKRFVADASHELRTPLTTIRGNADLLRIAPPEERELCIASIRRESERMSRLVADLLLLAAADIDEHPIHTQNVDLQSLLQEVHRSAVLLAGSKVTVVLDANQPIEVEGDPDRLKQLVLNLVDNAIKFTPNGGRVTLSLRRDREHARVEVTDTGVGIPSEDVPRVFDRFYRVEAARSTRGSGLGLSICSWIAAAHGGTIEVRSEHGHGSTFTVCLPVGAAFRSTPDELISHIAE